MFVAFIVGSTAPSPSPIPTCIDPTTFTLLNLNQYTGMMPTVINNNLGGVGPSGGPQNLYIRNVGRANLDPSNPHNGAPIDLRITATSDYRASNNLHNGFGVGGAGRFGEINIRGAGPICNGCTGVGGQWHPELTYTDFDMAIIHQPSGQLLDVTGGFQTFLTFYDLDSLAGQNGGPRRAIECIMVDSTSGSVVVHMEPGAALTQHAPQEVMAWVMSDGTHAFGSPNPAFSAESRLYFALMVVR